MPTYTTNLNLPVPLGNENNNRQAMVDLIEDIDKKVASKQAATTHYDDNVKHVTPEERSAWNAKAGTATATQSTNGLMSSTDKLKVDAIVKNNLTATVAPTITDDSSAGYSIGSRWIVTASSTITEYICVKNSVGSALWIICSKAFELYYTGNENSTLTGGWAIGYSYTAPAGSGLQAKNTNNLQFTVTPNAADGTIRTYETVNKVNVSDINKLYADVELSANSSYYGAALQLANATMSNESTYVASVTKLTSGRAVIALDVSSLNSSYHIKVVGADAQKTTSNTIKIHRVWGEI